jgi:nicotinamidase/pyrazinamidase
MAKTALILVDIQNDFCPGGAMAVPDGDAIVPVANALIPRFELVVAVRDWHPANHGCFAVNHFGYKVGGVVALNGQRQILRPIHCVQNSHGAAFAPDLDVAGIHQIIPHGTDPNIDSYSGFFDSNHIKSTGLGEYLKSEEVMNICVMGLATDFAVKFTALDARQWGFNTLLIEDGCRGINYRPGDVAAALEEMRSAGVQMIDSEEAVPV